MDIQRRSEGEHPEPGQEADAVARAIVDSAVEVHRLVGPGYAASVYEASLCHELGLRGIAYERQALLRVRYKDMPVGEGRIDLVVENLVVVEVKAIPMLAPIHTAQLISYLKASRRELGLVLNFGGPYMKSGIRRVVLTVWTRPSNGASASPSRCAPTGAR